MELWVIATLMGLDEQPELLQGPPVIEVPVAPLDGDGGPVVSGPRLRTVR